jgi:hypothetical protein
VIQKSLTGLLFTGMLALAASRSLYLQSPTAPEAGSPRDRRLRGRVLTPDGEPLVRVRVAFSHAPARAIAETDDEGRFVVESPDTGKRGWSLIVADAFDDPLTLVRRAVRYEGEPQPEYLVVAAPAVPITGRVVDEAGASLAGVSVSFRVRHEDLLQFPYAFDGFGYRDRVGIPTNAEGRFEARVPQTSGVLHCFKRGFRNTEFEWTPVRGDVGDIVMRAGGGRGDCAIRGTVRFADGRPAAGAFVRYGPNRATAAGDGRFCVAVRSASVLGPALCAALKGYQPVVLRGLGEALEAGTLPPQELVLERPALSIRGRIVDSKGRGLRVWDVQLRTGIEISGGTVPILFAEQVAGSSSRDIWNYGRDYEEPADGSFVIDGLLERDYVIEAWDHFGMQLVRSEPVPAGTSNLVLVAPADDYWSVVPGRVVDSTGRGVAGVEVRAFLDVLNAIGGFHNTIEERTARTARDGSFDLHDVPKNATIRCDGRTILAERFPLTWEPKDGELGVTVSRRCRLHFSSGALRPVPDALEVHDARGDKLPILSSMYWQDKTVLRYDLYRGAAPVLTVSEAARMLVLFRAGEEVARLPLRLEPEVVTTVRGAN